MNISKILKIDLMKVHKYLLLTIGERFNRKSLKDNKILERLFIHNF